MKKIMKLVLCFVILFGFSSRVCASTVTWSDITSAMKELETFDDKTKVTCDDTNLNISYLYDGFEYISNFKYEDNVVKFVVRDKSNLDNYEIAFNAFNDNMIIWYMLYIIGSLNDVDLNELDEEKIEEYGISYDVLEVSGTDDTGISTITADDIIKFEIDLDKFEEATESLRGTYSEEEEKIEDVFTSPVVSLDLEKANPTSLELLINVSDLSEGSTGQCEIYSIPNENESGSSKLIDTIDCVNGKNKYTVSNLKPNTKYTFQVVLHVDDGDGFGGGMAVGEKYVSFSTTEAALENISNPKTGGPVVYFSLICLFLSMASFIVVYNKWIFSE